MQRRRLIEAYGLCRDDEGQVLLRSDTWMLPGDVVAHGEAPAATVTRAVAPLPVAVADIRQVITELDRQGDVVTHHDRLIFDVRRSTPEVDSRPDQAVWVTPERLSELALPSFTASALGLPTGDTSGDTLADDAASIALGTPDTVALSVPSRHQRFAAYGLVTDPAGRILLARIAEGYPGAGLWHLPGGGTDFGEDATVGLLRELVEETDQYARVTGLMAVSDLHQRDALGPERIPIDWHGVRVVFRADVDQPTEPRVMEGVTGSTQAASWFSLEETLSLSLTDVAYDAVRLHNAQ